MKKYSVNGMSCAACQARVEKAVSGLNGVKSCSVSLLTNSMGVEGDVSDEEIIRAVKDAGYSATPKDYGNNALDDQQSNNNSRNAGSYEDELKDRETPVLKKRLLSSLAFLVLLMYITMGHNMLSLPLPRFLEHNHIGLAVTQMLLAVIVMFINRKFFIAGFGSIIRLAPNMDTLVAMGSSVSFGWSLYVLYKMTYMVATGVPNAELMPVYHDELYFEAAAMIPALITVGKMLEAMSKGKTTDALKSLMRLAPQTAVIVKDGTERTVPIGEVRVGDVFVVRPGESIPVDGEITEGSTAINEAALTGESIPVDKGIHDTVSAATINTSGYIRCKALRVGEDTTLSKIIQTVSDAAATKAPIARIADRVSGVFVPTVIGIALLVVIGWLICGASVSDALARGIAVLVISCPCALGLATPVAIMVGNGVGAKNGILYKTSEALEMAGKTDIVVLDKTGTITTGIPVVTDICPAYEVSKDGLLSLAYALEARSEHPLAKAIVNKAKEEDTELIEVDTFEAVSGNGVKATIDETEIYGGSVKFISSFTKIPQIYNDMCVRLSEEGKTPLLFVSDKELIGVIAVADSIRPDSKEAVRILKRFGLKTVMLTGDNEKTARTIAKEADIDEVIAGVMPDGKAEAVRDLKRTGRVIMVGDGINDAPALVSADIGIAIGAGTDVAIDSADIVLMNSRLSDVCKAIDISRSTLKVIHQNLFWAFFYNMICIPLAAGLFGYKLNPMIAAAAMSLSSFTVCMNALRLRMYDKKRSIRL